MLPAYLLLSQSLGLLVCLRWRPFGPAQGAMPSMPRAGPACNGAGPQRDRPVRPSNTTAGRRSEEHTSELQSLMRISYAVFCLQKNTHNNTQNINYANKLLNNKS